MSFIKGKTAISVLLRLSANCPCTFFSIFCLRAGDGIPPDSIEPGADPTPVDGVSNDPAGHLLARS
jgi:hypothetical protein